MSPLYDQQIIDLRGWFLDRLPPLGKFTLTSDELRMGCDALGEPWQSLTKEAFGLWKKERSYELSYRQMCSAFFWAASKCDLIVYA